MRTKKILVVDTETGGLDANKTSILSLGAVVWHDGVIEDELYLEIAEPDIIAEAAALKVNGINIEELKQNGVGPLTAVQTLENFLQKNDMHRNVYLSGHNLIGFDLAFIKRLYSLAGADFRKKFSYHMFDTMILGFALDQANRLGMIRSVKLDDLCQHFKITIRSGDKHNSLEDARATAKLMTELFKMLEK